MAPRNAPVVAAADGRVVRLFRSVKGGITLYQLAAADERVRSLLRAPRTLRRRPRRRTLGAPRRDHRLRRRYGQRRPRQHAPTLPNLPRRRPQTLLDGRKRQPLPAAARGAVQNRTASGSERVASYAESLRRVTHARSLPLAVLFVLPYSASMMLKGGRVGMVRVGRRPARGF